jgi:hypothetical protein
MIPTDFLLHWPLPRLVIELAAFSGADGTGSLGSEICLEYQAFVSTSSCSSVLPTLCSGSGISKAGFLARGFIAATS